ncbi:SUKH-4 family immunity protein [Phytomonospora sp. NPDC050363]|uniref:SUKH-4 family immunity protein n=1 Tax=Phytomonospora sp. NPDC050363 TaxID=3155642 RepID=UPI003408CE25
MLTHADMSDLYGDVVTLDAERVAPLGLRDVDARVLIDVGLPRFAAPSFTVEVEGGPDFLTFFDVETKFGPQREVVFGGPPGRLGMRYSVNAGQGFVMLAQLRGKAHGEIVNNDLAGFVTFLHAVDSHRIRAAAEPEVAAASFAELSARLHELDPHSFEDPEQWWATILARVELE